MINQGYNKCHKNFHSEQRSMENTQQLLIYRNYKILLGYKTFLVFIKKNEKLKIFGEYCDIESPYIYDFFKLSQFSHSHVGQHAIL